MEVLVLALKSYDFKNDNGEDIRGNKLYYICNDSVEGVEGFAPMQINLEDATNITVLPAIYKLDLGMKQGRNNKPEVFLKSAEFISECVDLFEKVS